MSTAAASAGPAPDALIERGSGVAAGARGLPRQAAMLVILGCVPLMTVALLLTWTHPAYRFAGLGWLAAGWLLRRNWRELPADLVPGTHAGSAVLLGASWVVAVLATIAWSPWGGVLAAASAATGLAWWAGAWPAVRALLPGLVLGLLCTPPPLGLDSAVLDWLGTKTVSAASRILLALAVPHFVGLHALEAPRLMMPMEPIRGMAAALPLVLAWGWFNTAWWRRPAWRGVLALGAGAVFTGLMAVLAVIVGVRGSVTNGVDLFAGARGWLLLGGVAVFAGALTTSFDQLIQFFASPGRDAQGRWATPVARVGSGPRLWVKSPSRGLARNGPWAFAVLGLAQVPLAALFLWHEFNPPAPLLSRLPPTAQLEPGPTPAGWTVTRTPPAYFPPPLTNAATRGVWFFERGRVHVSFTIEYPARSTEDFAPALELAGWGIADRRAFGPTPDVPAPWTGGVMQKSWLQLCAFWVAVLDEDGRWAAPEPRRLSLWAPFRPRVHGGAALRVFAVAAASEPLTETESAEAETLFQTLRAEVARQFLAALTPP